MADADRQSAELMAALQRGEDGALATLVARWEQPLWRFVFRYVQNEADARDLVQETFVRLHATRQSFRIDAPFSGWIFAIAANLARNHARWRKRHPGESHAVLDGAAARRELESETLAPDESALAAERVRAVRTAIDLLPHDLKATLLLFEYEELSYREIGVAVGCSEKGVEARLTRARARLREALAGYLHHGTAVNVVPVIRPAARGV